MASPLRVALAAGAACLALAACSNSATTSGGSSPNASPRTPSPSWSSVFGAQPDASSDENGQFGCERLYDMTNTTDAYDPDAVEGVAQLLLVARDSTLKTRAHELIETAKDARAAKGTDEEFVATLTLGQRAIELSTYCLRRGYVKP